MKKIKKISARNNSNHNYDARIIRQNINPKIFLNLFYLLLSGIILTLFSFMIDQWFFSFLSINQTIFFIRLFSIVTMLGNVEWFVALIFILLILFVSRNKKFYAFLAAVLSSTLLSYLLKMIILRPRPFEYFNISSIIHTSFSSFPSGHALLIFTILPFLLKNFPKYRIFFWATALLVAFSRLYLGVHYLSDVVAGAFIGFMIGKIFIIIGEKNGWQ